MGKWTAKISQDSPGTELPKLTKDPFGGFVSSPPSAFAENHGGLTETEAGTIRAWLAFIGEPEHEIPETLDRCRADPETRAYFLRRAAADARRMFYADVLGTEPASVASLTPSEVARAVAVGLLPHDPGPGTVVIAKRWKGKQALALVPCRAL